MAKSCPQSSTLQKPHLWAHIRSILRLKHYSYRTEQACIHGIRRSILFHKKRHPVDMGEEEINQFLPFLAVKGNVSASTQNQALCAIIFLYKHVLHQELSKLEHIVWAKKPKIIPVVLFSCKQNSNRPHKKCVPANKIVGIKVAYSEIASGKMIRAAGGQWDRKKSHGNYPTEKPSISV